MRKMWISAAATCLMGWAVFTCSGRLMAQQSAAAPDVSNQAEPGKRGVAALVQSRVEALNKDLDLTDEQKKKIRPLLKAEFQRIREVQSNTSLSEGQVKRRTMSIRRSTHERIAEILTPEQKAKWQQVRQARHDDSSQSSRE
jgi:Spy/CpxP family protein refolding chaperone